VVEPAVLARVGELPTLPRCLVNQKVLRLEGAIRLELQPGILRSHPPTQELIPQRRLAPVPNAEVPGSENHAPTEHDDGQQGEQPPRQPQPLVHNAPPTGRTCVSARLSTLSP